MWVAIFQAHWKAVNDMKEFRFNWKYLMKKNEFWAAVFIVFAINVFAAGASIFTYDSNFAMTMTADYQFVLNNVYVNTLAAVILIIPVALGLVFSDADWLEEKRNTDILLYTRIDRKKNILVRFAMSIGVSFLIALVGFALNYLILFLVYGSGNRMWYAQDLPYNMIGYPDIITNNLWLSFPFSAVTVEALVVSIMLGLLSGLCYTISFYIPRRLLVLMYLLPFLILLVSDIVMTSVDMNAWSLMMLLQPYFMKNFTPWIVGMIVLPLLSILFLVPQLLKRDKL